MKLSAFDRFTLGFAPRWTEKRVRSRLAVQAMARHYEAAQSGRRTQGWHRNTGDANAVLNRSIIELRMHARDLIRNNGWARRGQRVIANNVAGTGIMPKAIGKLAAPAMDLWKRWAESTECESEGRHTFYGIQHLAMKSIAESGEVLIRRRVRRPTDNLTIPLQLQVLESDFLDTTKNFATSDSGGPIVQGVEFDPIGRRAAYWLFNRHPGNTVQGGAISQRIPAEEVIHVFYAERPGQARGISWFGASIVALKDLDVYEDATLLRQQIAACFAAFVKDTDGLGSPLGDASTDANTGADLDALQPGTIQNLPPGHDITFANPPTQGDGSFDVRVLRRIAASLGVTYEDLTGDYSNVNFSSARMARLAHWSNVADWQRHMLIPQLCDGVWAWAMEMAQVAGELPAGDLPSTVWTAPPMPMIEPDKEGLAYQRAVRTGMMTFSEMIREQGSDPDAHLAEYAADLAKLDKLGIKLDSDVRAVSAAGQEQPTVTADNAPEPAPAKTPPAKREEEVEIEVDFT